MNIETQLGYTHGPGSLDELATGPAAAAALADAGAPKQVITVRGISRTHSVFSRWHIEGCMNCQTHLEGKAHFAVPGEVAAQVKPEHVEVQLHPRKAPDGRPLLLTSDNSVPPGLRVQVR